MCRSHVVENDQPSDNPTIYARKPRQYEETMTDVKVYLALYISFNLPSTFLHALIKDFIFIFKLTYLRKFKIVLPAQRKIKIDMAVLAF